MKWKSNAAAGKSPPSKPRFSPGTRISRGCAWRFRTGRKNCASSNARYANVVRVGRGVLRIHRRIEKLERALGLSDRIPRPGIRINYVDAEGEVTRTLLMHPDGRREWIDAKVPEENRKETE